MAITQCLDIGAQCQDILPMSRHFGECLDIAHSAAGALSEFCSKDLETIDLAEGALLHQTGAQKI